MRVTLRRARRSKFSQANRVIGGLRGLCSLFTRINQAQARAERDVAQTRLIQVKEHESRLRAAKLQNELVIQDLKIEILKKEAAHKWNIGGKEFQPDGYQETRR